MELDNIDNLVVLDDSMFEVTDHTGDVSIHEGIVTRVHVPIPEYPFDNVHVFTVTYTND